METRNLTLTMDIISNPSTEEFIENYESKGIPVVIKDLNLKWKAFKWTDNYVANTIGYIGYDIFMQQYPVPVNNHNPGKYLSDIPIMNYPLKDDYTTPKLFKGAESSA